MNSVRFSTVSEYVVRLPSASVEYTRTTMSPDSKSMFGITQSDPISTPDRNCFEDDQPEPFQYSPVDSFSTLAITRATPDGSTELITKSETPCSITEPAAGDTTDTTGAVSSAAGPANTVNSLRSSIVSWNVVRLPSASVEYTRTTISPGSKSMFEITQSDPRSTPGRNCEDETQSNPFQYSSVDSFRTLTTTSATPDGSTERITKSATPGSISDPAAGDTTDTTGAVTSEASSCGSVSSPAGCSGAVSTGSSSSAGCSGSGSGAGCSASGSGAGSSASGSGAGCSCSGCGCSGSGAGSGCSGGASVSAAITACAPGAVKLCRTVVHPWLPPPREPWPHCHLSLWPNTTPSAPASIAASASATFSAAPGMGTAGSHHVALIFS